MTTYARISDHFLTGKQVDLNNLLFDKFEFYNQDGTKMLLKIKNSIILDGPICKYYCQEDAKKQPQLVEGDSVFTIINKDDPSLIQSFKLSCEFIQNYL